MFAIPKKIQDDFIVGEQIGKGTFGEVFKAKMKSGKDVAVKFESVTANVKLIQDEIALYKKLKGKRGFAKYIGSGTISGYDFLAIELLGPSLQSLLDDRGRPFELPTVVKIGIQLLDRLEILHALNVVHCDIKPSNITIGQNNPSELYLIDFGLSKTIQNTAVPFKTGIFRGTIKYLSIGAHEGFVSFLNDIESLGYMLAVLSIGELPWEKKFFAKNIQHQDKQTVMNAIHELKKSNFGDLLISLPMPIACFLAASQNYTHVERPDYKTLRHILK